MIINPAPSIPDFPCEKPGKKVEPIAPIEKPREINREDRKEEVDIGAKKKNKKEGTSVENKEKDKQGSDKDNPYKKQAPRIGENIDILA